MSHVRLGLWRALGAAVAALVLALLALTSSASAGVLGPPAPPDCPLDPPSGYMCLDNRPTATYKFVGAAPDPNSPVTTCTVTQRNATPPPPDPGVPPSRVQYRTSVECDHGLNQIIVDTKLLTATGDVVVASAPAQSCYSSAQCFSLSSTGDASNLPPGAYVQQATVKLVLHETGAPDPWVVTPGTSNPPTDPAQCAGGRYDTTCTLRLGVIAAPTVQDIGDLAKRTICKVSLSLCYLRP